MLTAKQENPVMANWIECTAASSGDKIWVNFDSATVIHRNDLSKYAEVSFIAGKKNIADLTKKETPGDLRAKGLK